MKDKLLEISGSNILVMGLTFKENCPDIRNSKVFDLIRILQQKGAKVDIFDPVLRKLPDLNLKEFELLKYPKKDFYDAIIFCVKHQELLEIGIKNIKSMCKESSVIYDITSSFPKTHVDGRL
jgi:UDP-N-acetyl-D-galactosamine dehydrogenase